MDKSLERIIRRALDDVPPSEAGHGGVRNTGHGAASPAVMTSDRDIHRTASVLIRERSDETHPEAANGVARGAAGSSTANGSATASMKPAGRATSPLAGLLAGLILAM